MSLFDDCSVGVSSVLKSTAITLMADEIFKWIQLWALS